MIPIIFFGSSSHCLVTLDALLKDQRYTLVAVVTQPAKPVGRKQLVTPTAVETWAVAHRVEVIKPASWKKDSSGAERARIVELAPVVGVLSNYGKILPQSVIDLFPKGIVNIHPSLLPKYRGPAPAVGAILNGDEVSGTSIMLLSAEMDAGPVLGTVEFPLDQHELPETYYEKGFGLGTQKLMELLPAYLDGSLLPMPQSDEGATYTKMLTKEDGKIDWTMSAEELDRKVRAYTPWPGTWTEIFEFEDGTLGLSVDMMTRTGVVTNDTRSSDRIKRLKILSGTVHETMYIPDSVQLEGDTARSWSWLVSRLD